MADIISFNDGSVETIFEPKDFKYLVEKYMGWDAKNYFENLISELQEQADYTKAEVNTDLGSYEASLESNTAAFQDIEEICRSMIADFNQEEGRNRLAALRPWRNKVEQIIKTINNQI